MSPRLRLRLALAAAIFFGSAAFFFLRRPASDRPQPATPGAPSPPAEPTSVAPAISQPSSLDAQRPPVPPAGSPIADALNAPGGTVRRDLHILDELFGAFHTNFPRLGNPVGENHEITAALAGANPVQFVFISPRHRAINTRGELCDRWGTPFRFHQVSGTQMEIRSAGPDRTFATDDDALFP
jgi:hypothetical protein